MEMEAVDEGALGRILVPEGTQGVKVNQPIAVILGEGEDAKALDAKRAEAAPAAAPAPQPATRNPSPATRASGGRAAAGLGARPPRRSAAGNGHAAGERIFVSPLARRMAVQAGLDLARAQRLGPAWPHRQGRCRGRDRRAARPRAAPRRRRAPARRAAAPGAAPRYGRDQVVALAGNAPYTEVPISAMRRVIARRLTESKQTVPHFYLTVDCEIDRAAGDARRGQRGGGRQALGQRLRHQGGGAGAAEGAGGERVVERGRDPALERGRHRGRGRARRRAHHADHQERRPKGLAAISAEMKDLAARARAGKLKLTEFQGGTFSISNLGMFGIKEFAAVINPPQGCILAIGAGEQRAGGEERRARGRDGDELHARLPITASSTARPARAGSRPSRRSSRRRR